MKSISNPRGAGRPPLPPGQKTIKKSICLTPAQWKSFENIGGSVWLREYLDRLESKARSR